MSDHLRRVWGHGLAVVLSIALALLAFVLLGQRAFFLALAVLFGVWLFGELTTSPNWPTNRLGRDLLVASLGAALAASVVLGLGWNRRSHMTSDSGDRATIHAAANEVYFELQTDGSVVQQAVKGLVSPTDAFLALRTAAFGRERHVLAAHLPFREFQAIQAFYEEASYPLSWALGQEGSKHVYQLSGTIERAREAVFPYLEESESG
jgi:hypothetical protein